MAWERPLPLHPTPRPQLGAPCLRSGPGPTSKVKHLAYEALQSVEGRGHTGASLGGGQGIWTTSGLVLCLGRRVGDGALSWPSPGLAGCQFFLKQFEKTPGKIKLTGPPDLQRCGWTSQRLRHPHSLLSTCPSILGLTIIPATFTGYPSDSLSAG